MTPTEFQNASLPKVYRSYKNSPHNPLAMALKFMIHHIEHVNEYESADPKKMREMDDGVVKLLQQGKAADKNGHLSYKELRKFVVENPNLIRTLLRHQRELHAHLKQHYPKIINEHGRIALTRGLNTDKPGKEHPLASYADVPDTGFGSHMHYRSVPLNNIWYTYMLGPKTATSEKFGNENEWLVSPHEIQKANGEDVKKALPRDNWHDLKKPHPGHVAYMDPNKLTKEDIDNIVENDPHGAISFLKDSHLINKGHMDKMVEGDSSYAAQYLSHHPLFDKTNVDTIVRQHPASAAQYLSHHPALDKFHIDKISEEHPRAASIFLKDHPLFDKNSVRIIAENRPISIAENMPTHPLVDKEILDQVVPQSSGPGLTDLANNEHFNKDHMDWIAKHRPDYIAKYLRDSPLVDKSHLDALAQAQPSWLAQFFYKHPALDKSHIDRIVDTDPDNASLYLNKHPLLDKSHIDKMVETEPSYAAQRLSKHPAFDKSHIDKIIEKKPNAALMFLDISMLNKKHIDKLVDKAPHVAAEYLGDSPLLDKSHIDKIVEKSPAHAAQFFRRHPLLNKKHIDKIIETEPATAAAHLNGHPLFDKSHIDKIMEKSPDYFIYLKNHLLLKKDNLEKSIGVPEESISTKRTHNGMYFHTFRIGCAYHHILSHSDDPYSHEDAVAGSHVQKNGDDAKLKWTLSDSKHKGKGYATQVYLETLNHHKSLTNDDTPEELGKSTEHSHKVAILSD